LELGDDIHVVFARPGTDDKLKLEGEVLMSAPEVPGRPYTVYTATARGRVTREVVPGDYVCKDIIAVDENGDDWPFTGLEKMDLTVRIREQPSYELWVEGSRFIFDS